MFLIYSYFVSHMIAPSTRVIRRYFVGLLGTYVLLFQFLPVSCAFIMLEPVAYAQEHKLRDPTTSLSRKV